MIIYEKVKREATDSDTILDVGTKNGNRLSGAPGDLYGVDLDVKPEAEDVEFINSDGTRLPFPNETFDYIISNMVFEHVPADVKRSLVSEMSRTLKTDGEVYVSFPNRFFPSEGHGLPLFTKYLPRSVLVPLSERVLDRHEYYREFIHNITPISARRILADHFDEVSYSTVSIASEVGDSVGRWSDYYGMFETLNRVDSSLPVSYFYELTLPYTSYRCSSPSALSCSNHNV